MKKTTVIAAAATLSIMTLFGATATFAAEYENLPTWDYTMIDKDVCESDWVTAFEKFDVYIPSDFEIATNDYSQDGGYFFAHNDDSSRTVTIDYEEGDFENISQIASALKEAGADEVTYMNINGMNGIGYFMLGDFDEPVTTGFAVLTEDGGEYSIEVQNSASDEAFAPIGQNILCSFSLAE